MERSAILKAMRSPVILAIIGGTLLVLIIWLVVVFLPQGSKVNKLNTQAASLQSQQDALKARLRNLEKLRNSNLTKLHTQYSQLVPTAADTGQFLKQISALVGQSGASLKSITLSQPTAPIGGGAQAPGTSGNPFGGAAQNNTPGAAIKKTTSSAYTIAVSLAVTGTYDQQLRLMQLIYSAPRLTTIDEVNLEGGGPTSNRGTILAAGYTMTIYELPNVPTTTTTTTAP